MCHIYFKDNLKEVFEVLKSKFQQTASFHSIIEARLNTGNNNINECYSMVTAIYLIARIKEKLHLPVLLEKKGFTEIYIFKIFTRDSD